MLFVQRNLRVGKIQDKQVFQTERQWKPFTIHPWDCGKCSTLTRTQEEYYATLFCLKALFQSHLQYKLLKDNWRPKKKELSQKYTQRVEQFPYEMRELKCVHLLRGAQGTQRVHHSCDTLLISIWHPAVQQGLTDRSSTAKNCKPAVRRTLAPWEVDRCGFKLLGYWAGYSIYKECFLRRVPLEQNEALWDFEGEGLDDLLHWW